MKKQITSLADLETEKKKLEMTMQLTKQEFSRKLGTNKIELKDYFLRNVALPAGTIGIGLAAVKKFSAKEKTVPSNNILEISKAGSLVALLLPFVTSMFNRYFSGKGE